MSNTKSYNYVATLRYNETISTVRCIGSCIAQELDSQNLREQITTLYKLTCLLHFKSETISYNKYRDINTQNHALATYNRVMQDIANNKDETKTKLELVVNRIKLMIQES